MTNHNNWKSKGRAGLFYVWHAGKNLYYVTSGEHGPVIAQSDQYGTAFNLARKLYEAQPGDNLVAAAQALGKIEFVQVR